MSTNISFAYDQNIQSLVNTSTYEAITDVPTEFIENQYTWTIQIYNQAPTPIDLSSATEFRLGIGFVGGSGPIKDITNTSIDSTNANVGILVVTLDLDDSVLRTDIGSSISKYYYWELEASDGVNWSTIALSQTLINNTVYNL